MKKQKYTRKIIAIRGDTQSGHTGGLLNPETLLPEMDIDKEGKDVITGWYNPSLRPVQKKLWEWHMGDIENVRKLAGTDEIIFVEMGDLTQGNIFKDDLAETSLSAQVIEAQWLCVPWLEIQNLKRMRIVKGTGVHVWGSGATETVLTALLQKSYPKSDVKISSHWMLNVDGFRLDVAHHGPGPGMRNWTRGNVFELYLKSILKDDIETGIEPAHVVLRGHKHTFIYRRAIHQVKNLIWELPGFITPPYCFIGSHAEKTENSPSFMGVGILALEVINGKLLQYHPFTHFVDLRTEEVLS